MHKCLQKSLEFSGPEIKLKKFFMDLGSYLKDPKDLTIATIRSIPKSDHWMEDITRSSFHGLHAFCVGEADCM